MRLAQLYRLVAGACMQRSSLQCPLLILIGSATIATITPAELPNVGTKNWSSCGMTELAFTNTTQGNKRHRENGREHRG